MTFWNSMRSSFVSAWRYPRVWLVQFVGNAAIALLLVSWLHIDVATAWQVFLNLAVGILAIVSGLVLHGGTLNYYVQAADQTKPPLIPAFRKALKHALAFAICAAILYGLLLVVDRLSDYEYSLMGFLRSGFPAWLRRHLSENALESWFEMFVAFLRWVVIPGFLLPLGMLCAGDGFHGFLRFDDWRRSVSRIAYWMVLIAAGLIGVYCTVKLMNWKLHPEGPAVTKEGIWLGFRMLIAYVFALFSWLWVCVTLCRVGMKAGPPMGTKRAA